MVNFTDTTLIQREKKVENTVTITLDEYKALVKDSVMLATARNYATGSSYLDKKILDGMLGIKATATEGVEF